MIYLRPHHINCIYFFKGKGYNKYFVKNMQRIINLLEINQNEKIKFTIKCDDLCKHCPNNNLDICISNDMVLEYDKKTIEIYKLDLNKIYSFKEIKEKFYKNFDESKLKLICSNCEWFKLGLCKK